MRILSLNNSKVQFKPTGVCIYFTNVPEIRLICFLSDNCTFT